MLQSSTDKPAIDIHIENVYLNIPHKLKDNLNQRAVITRVCSGTQK